MNSDISLPEPTQSCANLASPVWHQSGIHANQALGKRITSNSAQSGKLILGCPVPGWTQSGKALKRQITNSNLGQSNNQG